MNNEANIEIIENTPDTAYFSVSLAKLRNMYLLTFGIYSIYWFYKHWKLQNTYSAPSVMPIARAIFAIFFTHALAARIKRSMENNKIPGSGILSWLATAFIVLMVASNILSGLSNNGEYPYYLDFIWIACVYLSVLPLIEMQDKVNALKNDPMGIANARYHWLEIILMIFGGVVWLLTIIGLILIAMGLA